MSGERRDEEANLTLELTKFNSEEVERHEVLSQEEKSDESSHSITNRHTGSSQSDHSRGSGSIEMINQDDQEEETLLDRGAASARLRKQPPSQPFKSRLFIYLFLAFVVGTLIISGLSKSQTPNVNAKQNSPESKSIRNIDAVADPNEIPTFSEINPKDLLPEISEPKEKRKPMEVQFHKAYHATKDIIEFYRKRAGETSVPVKVETLGQSPENRAVLGVQIGSEGPNKKGMWINCGFHAREWITISSCLYLFDRWISSEDQDVQDFLANVVVYMTPLANPDGYEFSRTTDRDWRKNRSPVPNSRCKGIDQDRNWPYKYKMKVDISSNPCQENYGGKAALDAPENKLIFDWITSKKNIGVAMDVHSYGLEIATPFGWTNKHADHFTEQMKAGRNMVNAIKSIHGTKYKLGAASSLIYKTSGIASDWSYADLGAVCSYTIEVRGGLNDGTEFILPKKEIIPNGEELHAGFMSLGHDLKNELCFNFKDKK